MILTYPSVLPPQSVDCFIEAVSSRIFQPGVCSGLNMNTIIISTQRQCHVTKLSFTITTQASTA